MKKLVFLILFVLKIVFLFSQTYFSGAQIITDQLLAPVKTVAIDLDGDGDNDVVVTSPLSFNVTWYENLADTAFSSAKYISNDVSNPNTVFAGDLDSDGDPDILTASTVDNKVVWFENLGNDSFSTQKIITTNVLQPNDVFAADLDGDGDLDVLSASSDDNKLAWYKNLGDTAFSSQIIITTQLNEPMDIYACDLDGDGDNDIVVASFGDDKIAWFENLGNGTFSSQNVLTTSAQGAVSVYASDLDGDGDLDILSGSYQDNRIIWFRNDGNGTFTQQPDLPNTLLSIRTVYAADLDGDGDNDITVAASGNNYVVWYENLGQGNFSEQKVISSSAEGAYDVFPADLDGDGDNDILVPLYSTTNVVWYENHSLKITRQPQDVNSCDNSTVMLTISVRDADTINWQVSSDGINFNDITDDSLYSGAQSDTLYINFNASMDGYAYRCYVANAAGSQLSDTAFVFLETEPPDVTVQNTTVYINNNGTATLSPGQIIVSASDNCAIKDTVIDRSSFNCADTGEHTVQVSVSDIDGNISTRFVTVTVLDTTAPFIEQLPDFHVYADDNGEYTAANGEFDPLITENCELDTFFNDYTNGPTLNGAIFNTGQTTVTWTAKDISGNIRTMSFVILVDAIPQATDDQYNIYKNQQLQANVSENDKRLFDTPVKFSLVYGVSNGTLTFYDDGTFIYQPDDQFVGNDEFTYQVCDKDEQCSEAKVSITVSIEFPIKIPVVFTPNGDGLNDVFKIYNIDKYPGNSLRILNRWGQIVYQTTDYGNTWDGTNMHTGEPLPEGAYFYILNPGDGSKPMLGSVYIRR